MWYAKFPLILSNSQIKFSLHYILSIQKNVCVIWYSLSTISKCVTISSNNFISLETRILVLNTTLLHLPQVPKNILTLMALHYITHLSKQRETWMNYPSSFTWLASCIINYKNLGHCTPSKKSMDDSRILSFYWFNTGLDIIKRVCLISGEHIRRQISNRVNIMHWCIKGII